MKGSQYLIERTDKGFSLRLDFSMNGKRPNYILMDEYHSFPLVLQGLYECLMVDAKTPDQRVAACKRMRRMKIHVLFDEEKVERVTVADPE